MKTSSLTYSSGLVIAIMLASLQGSSTTCPASCAGRLVDKVIVAWKFATKGTVYTSPVADDSSIFAGSNDSVFTEPLLKPMKTF